MPLISIHRDEEIMRALDDEENPDRGHISESENEDALPIEEDVESDFHDETSDTEEEQIRSLHDEDEEGWSSSDNLPLNNLQENSSLTSVIVNLTQANNRGKNHHVWGIRKGRTSSRTSATNIVRMARGPTRSVR